ncbi:syntaxin-11-like [Synchiropus picturatus]
MRDRLFELQTITSKLEEENDSLTLEAGEKLEEYMVVFEGEDEMKAVYKEAQSIRKEILHLRMDVKSLGKQNARFLTSMRRISSIKRDANAIGRDIKARGEAIYARLEKLRSRAVEDDQEASAALSRMVKSQHVSLMSAFQKEISEYHAAEMSQMENCKRRIQRQAEIMGQVVTREQIDEMVQSGKWNVFSDNLLLEGRSARSALSEIENRHKELLDLEGRIRDIHELFFQMALLVEEQGCMLDNIEAQVLGTQDYVHKASEQFKKAVVYKRYNPCRKLFCCCFPCCK